MTALEPIFSYVCGQNPVHTWAPGGELLPCCQRCTGFFAGAAVAVMLRLALRMRPGARFLQVHGGFLLLMVPLGFHWVPHGALVRTLSGILYGFGVVSFLWLFPGEWLPTDHLPGRRARGIYAAGVGACLVAVPALAAWGGRGASRLLAAAATAGLAGIVALALANLALGLGWLFLFRKPGRLRPTT